VIILSLQLDPHPINFVPKQQRFSMVTIFHGDDLPNQLCKIYRIIFPSFLPSFLPSFTTTTTTTTTTVSESVVSCQKLPVILILLLLTSPVHPYIPSPGSSEYLLDDLHHHHTHPCLHRYHHDATTQTAIKCTCHVSITSVSDRSK